LNWLLDRGCHVTFMDRVEPTPVTRENFTYVPYPGIRGMRFYRWLGYRVTNRLARLSVLAQLRLVRWRSAADVVHVHWLDWRAYDCAAAGLRPLVLTAWGSDVNLLLLPGADERQRTAVGSALTAADLVLVDSPDMPDKCAALAGRSVPTALLPLGINTNHFRPARPEVIDRWRRRLAIPDGAAVFMSVRAMGTRYGHDLILEAFAMARRGANRPAVLIYKVYNTKDYTDSAAVETGLRRRAEELGVADAVHWLNEVPVAELPQLFGLADAIVNFPSMDAFPVTFMEAAACQCPVITVDLPAYRGTFAQEFFRMVAPDDVRGLADALREHADGDLSRARSRLGAARERMVQEYDESVTARQLVEHYQRLVGAAGRRAGRGTGKVRRSPVASEPTSV
jgi:glycosyltransferase involved in cell wall biosynthesis